MKKSISCFIQLVGDTEAVGWNLALDMLEMRSERARRGLVSQLLNLDEREPATLRDPAEEVSGDEAGIDEDVRQDEVRQSLELVGRFDLEGLTNVRLSGVIHHALPASTRPPGRTRRRR